jgi:siroheme synthase-like protein
MGYFPFFVDIEGKPGLIVGGGRVALRKVEKLLPYGPQLRVVAPVVCRELESLPEVAISRRPFRPSDIDPSLAFAVAATDDIDLNRAVAARGKECGVLVNVVDRPQDSGFLFPALVQRGPLSVGISTSGASPTAAIWLKERVQELVPESVEALLDWMQAQRETLRRRLPQESQRAAALKALFSRAMVLGRPLTEEETEIVLGGADK